MSYSAIYRMIFTNDNENVDTIIHIINTTPAGSTAIIDMQDADGEWLTMSANLMTANDGEDKLAQIRSLKFKCQFLSTDTYNVDFFLAGDDNKWMVQVFLGSTSNPASFTGYLVPEGAKEIFLDHGLYGVELTASDYLPTLSELQELKPDSTVPKGKFTFIEYISWALQKTFLQLPIKVVYNLREENHTGADDHFFKKIFVDALTFETNINEREDSLTVLRKLLLGCFICQYNAEWWVIRVDEMDNTSYRIASFDYDGTYLSTATQDYTKQIGLTETIGWINEDASIYPERKIKYAKQTFKFEYPQELICNINYTRGTFNGVISVPAGYVPYYPIECWTNGKNFMNTPAAAESPAYLRKKITNGYEEERVLVLPATPNGVHWLKSSQVVVNKNDKVRFSCDRRVTTDHTGSGYTTELIFIIRLYGNDGSYWTCVGSEANSWSLPLGAWKSCTSTFVPTNARDWQYQRNYTNEADWENHSLDSLPIPVDGKIEILLLQSDVYHNVNDTHFANLQFEYIPIIDGVYQIVTGQTNTVSTTDNLKANKDDEIFISEAVSPQWKGVLFRYDGTNYLRIGNVYDYRLGTSGALGLTRFSKYQDFALWNQYNRTIRKFQGALLGLDTNVPDLPSMIHKYQFTDSSTATDNKLYQLLGFDLDLATCQWQGTFADVYDTVAGKDYSSDWEFKYTTK